jgi:hypothetical protein
MEQVDRELYLPPSVMQLPDECEFFSESSDDEDDDEDSDSEDSDDDELDLLLARELNRPLVLRPPVDADFTRLYNHLAQLPSRYWQDHYDPRQSCLLRMHTVEQWCHQQFSQADPRLFRSHFRMDLENFERLLLLIQDHPVFQNRSTAHQVSSDGNLDCIDSY